MTQSEAQWKMNLWVQIKWWGIYALLGIIAGVILGAIAFLLIEDISLYIIGLITLATSSMVTYLFGKTIIIQEATVEAGTVGVILCKGEVTDELLSPCTVPVVRSLYIPILGTQKMYDIYTASDKGRVASEKLQVGEVTTRDTKKTKGVEVLVRVAVRYRIYDPLTWAKNHLAYTAGSGGDTTFLGNLNVVLKTVVKKVIDHFTYDELDESSKCKAEKTESDYSGEIFADAIMIEIRKGHGGIECEPCGRENKHIRIAEWGVEILEILPESTLAVSDDFRKAREKAAVSQVSRNTAVQDSQSMLEIARNLRNGLNADGSPIEPPLEKNPYKNMSDEDLDTVVQRIMKIRVDPKEFIFHGGGSGSGSGTPGELLIQALVAKVLSGEIKL